MTMIQRTASSETTAETLPEQAACVSPEEIRQYLSGWSDDLQSERIEAHLATCAACEQAMQDLETRPDTLMQSLQSTVGVIRAAGDEVVPPTENHPDEPINAALAKARRLMDAPIESSKPVWQPANRELGVYELLRPLGRGGMGAVYLATHRQLKKQVAIKLLPVLSAEDSDVRARFQREIRVVGRLNHPSIVAATDAGEIDGTQFLVMEYVPGLDLSRLARLLGKLPVADACELMRQVALGLSCAHAEGVVHRDVKPSNLMLDEAGRIRILDFGLAQLSFWDEASVDLTTVGQLMGTLDYMAPEQAELCGGVDYRADLYALGATLFRLLCGRPPLAAAPNQSPLEKLRMLANHQPPKLDTLCPDAPTELVALVGSLLARSPQDRPASAAHVAEQLAAFTQSADLVGLLNRAREVEAQSPALLKSLEKPEKPGFFKKPGFFAANVSPAAADAGQGNRKRNRRWILAAAALPLMIIAGILIKLETDKGQLVIESEVDHIKVQIVHDGQPVSGLSINHGATSTRLRADKYEIVIDGPSDGLTIDNNQFTLQNGETVVARIRINATQETAALPIAGTTLQEAATSPPSAEPLYEGKSLTEWLEMLSRERSPTGLKSAFDACRALVSPATSDKITQSLLRILPGLDGEQFLTPDREGRPSSTVDKEAFKVLLKANPGPAYYTLWVRQFETADENWRNRLWRYWYAGDRENVEAIEPFVAWAERRLSQAPTGNPTIDADTVKTTDYLRELSQILAENQLFGGRVFAAFKNSPHLGTAWWLSRPLVYRSFTDNNRGSVTDSNLWPPAIKSEITRVAIETLDATDANPSLVAQACMILADGAELDAEQRTRILEAVDRRLVAASANPLSVTEMVETQEAFDRFSMPLSIVNAQFGDGSLELILNRGENRASVVLELLDVVTRLDGAGSVRTGLTRLQGWTLVGQRSIPQRSRGKYFGQVMVQIAWPELTPLKTSATPQVMQYLWGEHQPTAQDWLTYCIRRHPAVEEYLASSAKDSAGETPTEDGYSTTPPEQNPNKPSPIVSAPVYEGKTLQQWLDVIKVERSQQQFGVALQACSALATPEAGPKVTQVLLEVLPKKNGSATLQLTENSVSSIDSVAFEVIAKANPGRGYAEVLATQLASPDVAWRKRLTRQVGQGDQSKFENVEPLVAWAEKTLKEPAENLPAGTISDAASILRALVAKFQENKKFTESALSTLRDCSALGPDWWLALAMPSLKQVEQSHESGSAACPDPLNPNAIWSAALVADVTIRAIAALEDPASSPSHVAQAAMILNNDLGGTDEQDRRILAAVNRRFSELAKSEESLTEVVDVEPGFRFSTEPTLSKDASHIAWLNEGEGAKSCVTLELLDLFAKLRTASSSFEGLQSLVPLLVYPELPQGTDGRITISWPEFQVIRRGSFGRSERASPESRPADVMKFVINSHPAVIEFRAKTAVTPM